ncbi:MAG: hypothetical protein IPQ03_07450 [Bacteroidetes bacterium]|nr:hypothetical protein [Bacteroidota bacterium]
MATHLRVIHHSQSPFGPNCETLGRERTEPTLQLKIRAVENALEEDEKCR